MLNDDFRFGATLFVWPFVIAKLGEQRIDALALGGQYLHGLEPELFCLFDGGHEVSFRAVGREKG